MKHALFAATVCLGLASTCPAFARAGWSTPVNGTVSAVMMQNGGVMMEIKLPPAEYLAIGRDMKASGNTCVIKDTETGTPDSMILVCGPAGSTVQ